MSLEDDLSALQERVQTTGERLRKLHDASKPAVARLQEALAQVTSSWSGSCAGYHGRLYYRNFDRPPLHEQFSVEWGGLHGLPQGWKERTPEEVLNAIETRAGSRITTVEEAANAVGPDLESLRRDIGVVLAPIRQLPMLATEAKRLDALEEMRLRVSKHEYLKANMPGIHTRNSDAAFQGITIPAHLYYEAQLVEASSVFRKGQEFLQEADRLLRQVRAQREFVTSRPPAASDALARVIRLCERFPLVASQLQKRQRGRSPFEVKDEHDVQDLFHAMLHLDFDDVRPEEHAPSHAGSAPSIDFLLKSEQIVLETKMARESLTTKILGDQLLADIGRYAEHPDARTLVCFVYDPHRRLANPRGIESDLMKHSRESLQVVVVIAPR